MGVIGDKLNEKISNYNGTKYDSTFGTIQAFDNIKNTATVLFVEPNGGGTLFARNVPVKINGGGLTTASPVVGQKCWITFLNNSLLSPTITGLFDDEYFKNGYSQKTNSDSGAYVCSEDIYDVDTEQETTSMVDDYTNKIDKANYEEYTNIDVDNEAKRIILESDKYKKTEDGITNISTNGNIKMNEDGTVSVFSNNNTGIRLNPKTNVCEFFCKGFKINSMPLEDYIKKYLDFGFADFETIKDITKLELLFAEFDIELFIKIINYLCELNGMLSRYSTLLKQAREYKELREQYINNEIEFKDVPQKYSRAKELVDIFNKELDSCADIKNKFTSTP